MIISGIDFSVIGEMQSKTLRKNIPLIDIPMMSDERWNQLAAELKAKNKSLQSSS